MRAVLPDAVAIALLGAIESLLSAVVADGMTGRRHRSNCELVAQGIANIAAVTFGGMCVTGTIARTATNVRAGAHGPVAGMLHALYILLFMLVAAPLAAYIPLASLGARARRGRLEHGREGGVRALMRLARRRRRAPGDLPAHHLRRPDDGDCRWRHARRLSVPAPHGGGRRGRDRRRLMAEDEADTSGADRAAYDPDALDGGVLVYRISGAFFFGATAAVSAVLDRIGERPKAFVLDFTDVPLVDSTAAKALEGFVHKLSSGHAVYFAGAGASVRGPCSLPGCASRSCVMPRPPRMRSPIGGPNRQAPRCVKPPAPGGSYLL